MKVTKVPEVNSDDFAFFPGVIYTVVLQAQYMSHIGSRTNRNLGMQPGYQPTNLTVSSSTKKAIGLCISN